jgi:hypothetical protein
MHTSDTQRLSLAARVCILRTHSASRQPLKCVELQASAPLVGGCMSEHLTFESVVATLYIPSTILKRTRDSAVGIATRYGLEGPGIESRWGEIFRTYPDRLRGPPSLLCNGYRVFPGGKGGRGVMLTTHPLLGPWLRHTSTHPMGPSGPVTGFPLPCNIKKFHLLHKESLRYKPVGRGFDSRWCHWNFSVTILPVAIWPWG